MDGVLVRQTGRDGFDKMPWTEDGKTLWARLQDRWDVCLLSQLPDAIFSRCAPQKIKWARTELGPWALVIVVPDSMGKSDYSAPGNILIDDGEKHRAPWVSGGGRFILHRSAAETIKALG